MTENEIQNRRIIVIDDNTAIHDDFRKILSGSCGSAELDDDEAFLFDEAESSTDHGDQYEVDTASQGKDGYEMVKRAVAEGRPYAVAFVDMRMPPGWDGVETISHLWHADRDVLVVICTAYSDYSWQEMIDRLGQSDRLLILKKPFDVVEVAQLAAALTRKWDMQQQLKARMNQMEEAVEERTRDLKDARDDSERLLGAISSLLIEVDDDKVIRRWNQKAEEVFGISADEAVGSKFSELNVAWLGEYEGLLENTDTADGSLRELEFRDADGMNRSLGFTAHRIHGGPETRGVLLLGSDLTEQRALEQQLRAAQKLEAVGQLAAGVAHEINTPLQYVGDNIQYLKSSFDKVLPPLEVLLKLMNDHSDALTDMEDELSGCLKPRKLKSLLDQVPEAIEDSVEGVQTVSRIVRAMKEFSHPGAEEKSPVDLNHALETTITVSRNEWKYVAEVETDLDPNLSNVPAFPGELNQVFLNLVVNGAHAIVERLGDDGSQMGRIGVSTHAGTDYAEVRISDSGAGIPERVRDRVFDPFFTTKEVGKGTGQGLAIAYNVIVQKHHGQIWFETEPGEGTTFFIRLPLTERGLDENPAAQSGGSDDVVQNDSALAGV